MKSCDRLFKIRVNLRNLIKEKDPRSSGEDCQFDYPSVKETQSEVKNDRFISHQRQLTDRPVSKRKKSYRKEKKKIKETKIIYLEHKS